MTTINNIADLARILREQPEWADTIRGLLLSRELLALPDQFAQFTKLVNHRLDKLETDLGEFKVEVRNEFDQLKGDMNLMQGHMNLMQGDMNLMKGDMNLMKADINQMKGDISNLKGTDYEFKVVKNIKSTIGQHLRLRRVRVLQGVRTDPDRDLEELIENAEDNGAITEGQSYDLSRSDLIASGWSRTSGEETYLTAEISVTIGDGDVTRSVQRAAILEAVVDQPVVPAIVGAHIDETRAALAASNNVAVILVPE